MDASVRPPSISDFKLIKPISRGAFGKVFLAAKTNDEKLYAIKIVSKEEMKRKNLMDKVTTERNALAVSKCPYIVHLYYSLQSLRHIYLVMEYLIGGDLKTLLMVLGYLKDIHAAIYTVEISIALEYLHSHGIIHRDLKPDNILITAAGHLKLTDFGLSTLSWNRSIQPSDVLNTPSVLKVPNEYYRTPGQLISLTTDLSFSDSPYQTYTPAIPTNATAVEPTMLDSTEISDTDHTRDRSELNRTVCSPDMMFNTEMLATNLAQQLDEDAKLRWDLRQRILQSIQLITTQDPPQPDTGTFPPPKVLWDTEDSPPSLSEIIHHESLLSLTEIFAGADPQEVDAVKSFISKSSTTHLLRAGLLIRQLSLPVFGSPPLHTNSADADDERRSCTLNRIGPLRRSKSYSQPEIRRPYPLRYSRYTYTWSPTMLKNSVTTSRFHALRRATLPPLPHSPRPDGDQVQDDTKQNLTLTIEDSEMACSTTITPTLTPKRTVRPTGGRRLQFSPQPAISPVRNELTQLHLNSGTFQSSVLASVSPADSPSFPSAHGSPSTECNVNTQPTVQSEVQLSSAEKFKLRQFYSPAPFSVQDLQHGVNLAEIDPSHPLVSCRSAGSPIRTDTPLRTPRHLSRQRPVVDLKTHPGHFPYRTPLTGPRDMHSVLSSRLLFDSSESMHTPLGVLSEIGNAADSPHAVSNWSVNFFNSSIQPRAPPCSPVGPILPKPSSTALGTATKSFANHRLMGTPEYIAPELLLPCGSGTDSADTAAVDWWALGVILFEMLTGSTPFADETPESIFENILNLNIPWPGNHTDQASLTQSEVSDALSSEAVELITALLSRLPADRLVAASQLRTSRFLAPVGDWTRLNELEMPFVPCPENSTDTFYFRVRNEANDFEIFHSGAELPSQQ